MISNDKPGGHISLAHHVVKIGRNCGTCKHILQSIVRTPCKLCFFKRERPNWEQHG